MNLQTLAKNIFLASFNGFSENVNNSKFFFTKMLITSKINIQLNFLEVHALRLNGKNLCLKFHCKILHGSEINPP